MNIFDNQIMNYQISLSTNGDDNTPYIITKKIIEFKSEIMRVKSLTYYKGEDNHIIDDIEKIIKKKYIQYLLNIFFTTIRLKIKCIQFRKRYYMLHGIGFYQTYQHWKSYYD